MPSDNGFFMAPAMRRDTWATLPPRSVLYNLEPYAGPEAQRESIISYIIRLAHTHSLNPRHLVNVKKEAASPQV
jgi:hypothetical protein